MSTTSPTSLSSTFSVPSSYGKECRPLFFTDPDITNLNHGSFGAISQPIQHSCEALTREIEKNPDAFIRMELFDRQTAARRAVAGLIGAGNPDTCVFISNVSTAMNTVLKSFKWSCEDYIVCTDAIFPSILLAIENVNPAPKMSSFDVGGLTSHKVIVSSFLDHLRILKKKIHSQCGKTPEKTATGCPKVVVIMESITATPALLLPWREMVNICRDEEVWSVVDAAHSLGQESGLNVEEADPDFWMTDCAKWYYAMRGCALLYVPVRNQEMITPLVPGVRYPTRGPSPSKFVHSFFWNGMTDPVASLSIEFAITFRERLGGDRKLNAYCHDLVVDGGHLLAKILGTNLMDASETAELTPSMVSFSMLNSLLD
ncbi:hypothetical protein D9619_008585 [Psilocybe cf. subviscida]|uniref:Aminotransferase class V domain-containing protein n=1 Tax=Psilocybe cf. subviscida TaxID=2480587 RepID=A0A8H5F0Z9_9AGAR|nr:hypothetical protein D9619_008585 [Psilocybe cf. subviscida]